LELGAELLFLKCDYSRRCNVALLSIRIDDDEFFKSHVPFSALRTQSSSALGIGVDELFMIKFAMSAGAPAIKQPQQLKAVSQFVISGRTWTKLDAAIGTAERATAWLPCCEVRLGP